MNGNPDTLRQAGEDPLVPLFNVEGTLWNIQAIVNGAIEAGVKHLPGANTLDLHETDWRAPEIAHVLAAVAESSDSWRV